MSVDAGFVAVLTDLLESTDVAHRAYEEAHGPAPEWPQWYAARIVRALGDSYREQDILSALLSAATAHGVHEQVTGRPDPEWASWYAEHMAARLSRDWYASAAEEEAIWDA